VAAANPTVKVSANTAIVVLKRTPFLKDRNEAKPSKPLQSASKQNSSAVAVRS
jgi:hypothetical protein